MIRLPLVLALLLAAGSAPAWAQDYHVDAVNGSDATGDGSPGAPWRSLTHASQVLGSGPPVRLHLAAGTYDETTGERFPIPLGTSHSLVGAGAGNTRIRGSNPAGRALLGGGSTAVPGTVQVFSGIDFDGQGQVQAGLVVGVEDFTNTTVIVRDCRFRGFTAAGVEVHFQENVRQYPLFDRCHFENNAIGLLVTNNCINDSQGDYTVRNSVFRQNQIAIRAVAGGSGNPIALNELAGSVVNNTFLDQIGSAIALAGDPWDAWSRPSIVNNIFAGGGAFAIENGPSTDPLRNNPGPSRIAANLFWNNLSGAYLDTALGAFPAAADVNTLPAADPAHPNLDGNPRFADPASGDVHLTAGSAAIDQGSTPDAPADDFEGEGRPADGDGDGRAVADIGADEFDVLRRADLSDLAPRSPDLGTLYPFSASNPLTPVLIAGFASGDSDPDTGILSRLSVPLALYQVDAAGALQLRLVKDTARDSLILTLAP